MSDAIEAVLRGTGEADMSRRFPLWGIEAHRCNLLQCRGCGKYHCVSEKECWT